MRASKPVCSPLRQLVPTPATADDKNDGDGDGDKVPVRTS
jgi:hypothetical protein